MVFHSHYMVTDKKTGNDHNLCCYNTCDAINDDFKDEYSEDSEEESRDKTLVNYSLERVLANYNRSEYRERLKAYRAAMMNKVPSGYSSDEFDSEIPIAKSSTKHVKKSSQTSEKISQVVVDNSKDNECMEIDATEFYETVNSQDVTDTGSSNNFKTHNNNNSVKDLPILSNSFDNHNSEIVKMVTQQKLEAFNNALEDARKAMTALIDNFYLEQPMKIKKAMASSSESQQYK
jgi:hypothetical protein